MDSREFELSQRAPSKKRTGRQIALRRSPDVQTNEERPEPLPQVDPKKKGSTLGLPNQDYALMADVLMNGYEPYEKTEQRDIDETPSNLDSFFEKRAKTLENFELLLKLQGAQRGRQDQKVAVITDTWNAIQLTGLKPTMNTYLVMVSVLCDLNLPDKAMKYFDEMKERKEKLTLAAYDKLMKIYCTKKDIDAGIALLDELHRSLSLQPDCVIYTRLIDACIAIKDNRRAWSLYQRMREKMMPDPIAFETIMGLCNKEDKVERAMTFFEETQRLNVQMTANSYMHCISAAAKRKDDYNYKLAYELFNRMKNEGFAPTMEVYATLLAAPANRGDIRASQILFNDAATKQEEFGPLTEAVYSRMIQAYAANTANMTTWAVADKLAYYRSQNKQVVQQIYDKMKSEGLNITTSTLNYILKFYCKAKYTKDAMEFLDTEYEKLRIKPNLQTYQPLIFAFAVLREVDQCFTLYQRLKDEGLVPDRKLYILMIYACARCNYFTKALNFLKEMRQKGFTPWREELRYLLRKVSSYPDIRKEVLELVPMGRDTENTLYV